MGSKYNPVRRYKPYKGMVRAYHDHYGWYYTFREDMPQTPQTFKTFKELNEYIDSIKG